MSDVTQILTRIDSGDPSAAERLLPLIYAELRRLASCRLASESPEQTLTATALVHEAYLRLVGGEQPERWNGRGHFFAAAAEAMRRILVESARRRNSVKRGGEFSRVEWHSELDVDSGHRDDDLLALDEALDELAVIHPQKAELVKLRFFAGLPMTEAADTLGVSLSTAKRHWVSARAWLYGRVAR